MEVACSHRMQNRTKNPKHPVVAVPPRWCMEMEKWKRRSTHLIASDAWIGCQRIRIILWFILFGGHLLFAFQYRQTKRYGNKMNSIHIPYFLHIRKEWHIALSRAFPIHTTDSTCRYSYSHFEYFSFFFVCQRIDGTLYPSNILGDISDATGFDVCLFRSSENRSSDTSSVLKSIVRALNNQVASARRKRTFFCAPKT